MEQTTKQTTQLHEDKFFKVFWDESTRIIGIDEYGQRPGHELIERANGIRQRWINYWEATTGHRATMTTNPR